MDTVRHLKHRIKNIKWKNVKRTASIAKGKAVSKVKDFYMTDFENRIRKATSNRNWSMGSVQLAEIAQYSYNPLLYKVMMDIVYSRLKDKGHNWKRVYKALELIRYLLLHGAPGVLLDMQHNVHIIESLENFRYVHPKTGRDVGQNVRSKAKQVVDLIRNPTLLEKERQQSRAMLDKISQSRRVAYSSNASYPNAGTQKTEEVPGKRISQRVIVSSDGTRGSMANAAPSTSRNSNSGFSGSEKINSQPSVPSGQQRMSQEPIENDLLNLDDWDQDDYASVSEESSHGLESDKDFGDFVESFSDFQLEESSTKDSEVLLTNLDFSKESGQSSLPQQNNESRHDLIPEAKSSAGQSRESVESKKDAVIVKKHDEISSAPASTDSKPVTKNTSKDSISTGSETKKVASQSNSMKVVTSAKEEEEEDPFGQLVSEWIRTSHSQRR